MTPRFAAGWDTPSIEACSTSRAARFSPISEAICIFSAARRSRLLPGPDRNGGWTVGGGVEWALDPRWSIKGEYLYYDAGTETVKVPNCGVGGCGFSIGNTGNLVRIGVNYRFGAR